MILLSLHSKEPSLSHSKLEVSQAVCNLFKPLIIEVPPPLSCSQWKIQKLLLFFFFSKRKRKRNTFRFFHSTRVHHSFALFRESTSVNVDKGMFLSFRCSLSRTFLTADRKVLSRMCAANELRLSTREEHARERSHAITYPFKVMKK